MERLHHNRTRSYPTQKSVYLHVEESRPPFFYVCEVSWRVFISSETILNFACEFLQGHVFEPFL